MIMFESLSQAPSSLSRTLIVLLAVALMASVDLVARAHHKREHYVFGVLMGTALSVGFIRFVAMLFAGSLMTNAAAMALGVFLLIVAWRVLFGPWEAHVKATVLGTFLFWVLFSMLYRETGQERIAHLIAIGFAIIPALVWCALFLPYHRERLSTVLVMFFSGAAATIPVLFYDALARNHVELQFFVLRIVPESFNTNVQIFFREHPLGLSALGITLLSMFVSFAFVGLLEEGSKYWVLKRNGLPFFTSIDDAIQLAILVAIGFAFAENVTTTGYFYTFVKQYLVATSTPDWAALLGNIAGRSILTSMVHIVSTGLLGYFLGLATFADPLLRDGVASGRRYRLASFLHRVFQIDRTTVFRTQMLLISLPLATFLHALSNFLVSLPETLPGNPRTLGDLLGSAPSSPLHYIAILLLPSLLYVVGGFWLLTTLFGRLENEAERKTQAGSSL